MPSKVEYGVSAIVSVAGQRLAPALEGLVTEVVVHNHTHLPDMVEVRLRDDGSDPLASSTFRYGHPLEVAGTHVGADAAEQPLFTGELTSIETEYDAEAGTVIVLRGYDKSHRLMRGTRSRAFLRSSFSDIVRKVAGEAGLAIGAVTSSSIVYEHMVQFNEADWDFLQRLARENDCEVVSEAGKLIARPVPDASSAPLAGQVGQPPQPKQLVLGGNLISLQVRSSSSGQVGSVTVRSWDWKNKQPIEGRATVATQTIVGPPSPAQLANPFGTTSTLSFERPLESQQQATVDAEAIAERIASSSVEVVGSMQGDPTVKAGAAVTLSGAGSAFDGKYVVTAARHVFTEDGFRTEFEVTGRHDRSLLAMAEGPARTEPGRVEGVVVAIVTNNDDPERYGRVKLKFPWLSPDLESDWARIATLDAGSRARGSSFLPEVNDEVLVAFDHGDVRRPYVIGALWNGKDLPPANVVKSGQVVERSITSRTGHRLIFNDDPAAGFVEVVTAKGHSIRLEDQQDRLVIEVGQASIEMKSTGDVVVKGMNITLDATSSVEIKAPMVKVNGSGQTEIKGGIVRIN